MTIKNYGVRYLTLLVILIGFYGCTNKKTDMNYLELIQNGDKN